MGVNSNLSKIIFESRSSKSHVAVSEPSFGVFLEYLDEFINRSKIQCYLLYFNIDQQFLNFTWSLPRSLLTAIWRKIGWPLILFHYIQLYMDRVFCLCQSLSRCCLCKFRLFLFRFKRNDYKIKYNYIFLYFSYFDGSSFLIWP